MHKVFFLPLFLYCNVTFCQNNFNKIEIFTEKRDSVKSPSFNIVVHVAPLTKNTLNIISETTLSEFYCNYGGALGLQIEKIDGSCYKNIVPDCNPTFPESNRKTKPIVFGDTVNYLFDIGKLFDRIRYKNGEIKFKGCYRIKVIFRYSYNNNKIEETVSQWKYIFFDV